MKSASTGAAATEATSSSSNSGEAAKQQIDDGTAQHDTNRSQQETVRTRGKKQRGRPRTRDNPEAKKARVSDESGSHPIGGGDNAARTWMADTMNTAEEQTDKINDDQHQQRSASGSLSSDAPAAEGMQVDDATRAQIMQIAAKVINEIDITEIFSPVRVVAIAEKMGLIGGLSMDLRTGWDFTRAADRERCRQYIRRVKFLVVIGSPPCTMFSRLQNLNWGKSEERDAKMHTELKIAKEHIDLLLRDVRDTNEGRKIFRA